MVALRCFKCPAGQNPYSFPPKGKVGMPFLPRISACGQLCAARCSLMAALEGAWLPLSELAC